MTVPRSERGRPSASRLSSFSIRRYSSQPSNIFTVVDGVSIYLLRREKCISPLPVFLCVYYSAIKDIICDVRELGRGVMMKMMIPGSMKVSRAGVPTMPVYPGNLRAETTAVLRCGYMGQTAPVSPGREILPARPRCRRALDQGRVQQHEGPRGAGQRDDKPRTGAGCIVACLSRIVGVGILSGRDTLAATTRFDSRS